MPRSAARPPAAAGPSSSVALRTQLPPAVTPVATSEQNASPAKPKFESTLKPKSVKRVTEELDIVINAQWLASPPTTEDNDFGFVDAGLIRAPLRFVRPMILNHALYPKMSSAIKKFEYDPKTQLIEVRGEASGLHAHSWVKVDQRYWDEIRYDIVRGDMMGFKVRLYLWDFRGKTLVLAQGTWPQGKRALPPMVALVFKPVAEIVLGVATRNFRSYIEEEYRKH